ncbi:transmembrane amino acid transporter protein-domain-containing protein [Chytriomyces sp. MP71]|nr:transmembrane amino acid transporter protein-domain-containing protein [Chytriomyces sp. MP71]
MHRTSSSSSATSIPISAPPRPGSPQPIVVATPDEGDGFPPHSLPNNNKRALFGTSASQRRSRYTSGISSSSSNWFSDFGLGLSASRPSSQNNSPSPGPSTGPRANSGSSDEFCAYLGTGGMNMSPEPSPLASYSSNLTSTTTAPAAASIATPVPINSTANTTGSVRSRLIESGDHTATAGVSISAGGVASSPLEDIMDDAATSTPIQATLNSANVMLGMGILTLPYGLHIAGWLFGLSMITIFALTAQFTAKLIGKCMTVPFPPPRDDDESTPLLSNPHRHRRHQQNSSASRLPTGISDVVELAFGPGARPWIQGLFMVELFAAATGLILLGADSIVGLWPQLPMLPVKCAVTGVLVLSTMPRGLGWLAYSSLLGVLTVASLFMILVFNGLKTPEAPGSLWEWSETDFWPSEVDPFKPPNMWLSAGLFMIGLDAHAIFPGIYRDLKQKRQWGRVVEGAFACNWILYVGFATVGYLMFGQDILPQVTQNFPLIPTFPRALTHFIVVLTALNPFTKYALIMAPVHLQCEQILRIAPPAEGALTTSRGALLRVSFGMLAVATTIAFPTFHVLIGLVGSLFSFLIAGVVPCVCYLRLGTGRGWRQEAVVESCRVEGFQEWVLCGVVVAGSLMLGGLGTVASVYSGRQ